MGRPSEINEAIMLDQYIEALLENPDTPRPANLDPELAQLAQTIMLSLNQNVEYPMLLDIWQDSLAQAQYLATKSVAHSNNNGNGHTNYQAQPTLTSYGMAERVKPRWRSSILMSSAGMAAILLMVMLIGVYQLLQTDEEPSAIQSAHKKATDTATSTITFTPLASLENTTDNQATVVLPDRLTCQIGETISFDLANVGQAVSVVSSDIFSASVKTITSTEDDRVLVEVECLDAGEIELIVTIVQDLESFSETIDLAIRKSAEELDAIVVTPETPISTDIIPSPTQRSGIPTATPVDILVPTNTPDIDAYPAPIIETELPTVFTCGVGGEIALEYTYTSASGIYTASRLVTSNYNVRDRVVTTDNGIGALVMACDTPGTTTATLYVFYPEFGIPPDVTGIATSHTMSITVSAETATPVTPDPDYPVPLYDSVPDSLTCTEGQSQRVDITFSANDAAGPGAIWLSVSSSNGLIANAYGTSTNQVDSGFFWVDCEQVGSATVTLQLYRLVDSGDPSKTAYYDLPVTVNSAATETPDPDYPVPSFIFPPSTISCQPNTVIQISFTYEPNPEIGGPVTSFAQANSPNNNIAIQNLTHDSNHSTLYLACNNFGGGTVTLYIYKEGDVSFSDMQNGNWSKAATHLFPVNVESATPTPTPTATFTPIATPTQ